MQQIFLPTAIEFFEGDLPNTGRVVVTPCHQGYGTTLGNALRRVLLSSLPGAAVESVKINGVQHEFSAVPGVKEDMIEIILNIKQMAVRCHSEEPVTLSLTKKGVGDVLAGDFSKNADVDIINPDTKIATMTDKNATLEMEISIGRGRGYVPVGEKETKHLSLGTIAIDSLYTPIRDVGYQVEMTRVGDVTDYEKLTLTIETNGTVAPKEALNQATKILMDHFALILSASGGVVGPAESELVASAAEEVLDEEKDTEKKETKEKKTRKKKE